ncbi:MAG: hypothetical protein FWD24_08530 [Treponema sp.]|nr:hypothetical protein [Treponema sp.]
MNKFLNKIVCGLAVILLLTTYTACIGKKADGTVNAQENIAEANYEDLNPRELAKRAFDFVIFGLWEDVEKSGFEIEIKNDNSVSYFTHARLDSWEGKLAKTDTYNYQFHVTEHYIYRLGMEEMNEIWHFTYNPETKQLRYHDGTKEYLFTRPPNRQVSVHKDWILEMYSSYNVFIDNNQGAYERLVFSSFVPVKDFQFIKIGHNDEPFYLFVDGTLYSGELLPEKPLAVSLTELSRIPQRGVSFKDENNIRRYFYIGENTIEDDHHSYFLSEFEPQYILLTRHNE